MWVVWINKKQQQLTTKKTQGRTATGIAATVATATFYVVKDIKAEFFWC
jgi:hypothetical protein